MDSFLLSDDFRRLPADLCLSPVALFLVLLGFCLPLADSCPSVQVVADPCPVVGAPRAAAAAAGASPADAMAAPAG